MELKLIRDYHGDDCSLGVLYVGDFQCQTIERPWIAVDGSPGGHPQTSCVPAGVYGLVRHDSPKHPHTWALVNHGLDIYHDPVDGKRSDCLIHPANYASELEGCIAPGSSRNHDSGVWMVVASRATFAHIQALVPWTDDHTLVIE